MLQIYCRYSRHCMCLDIVGTIDTFIVADTEDTGYLWQEGQVTSLPSTAPSLLLVAGACSVSMLGLPSATSPHQQHVSPWRAVCIYCVSYHCITASLYPPANCFLWPYSPAQMWPAAPPPPLPLSRLWRWWGGLWSAAGDITALMLTKTREDDLYAFLPCLPSESSESWAPYWEHGSCIINIWCVQTARQWMGPNWIRDLCWDYKLHLPAAQQSAASSGRGWCWHNTREIQTLAPPTRGEHWHPHQHWGQSDTAFSFFPS